jgi:PAS domain S-box-containing protein
MGPSPKNPRLDSRNSQPATNRLVVVAEDNEGLNRLICTRLERQGLKAVAVFTGAAAVAAVREHPDCLLLLDYVLPDVNGKQVLAALAEGGYRTPFIVMTGRGDERVAVDMMKLGARDYLIKSGDFLDMLVPVVERVLDHLATEERPDAAQKGLREFEEAYRTLAKNLPGLVYRCDLRQGGTMQFMNDLLVPMTGYHPEELRAGTVHSIEPLIVEADRPGVVAEIERAVAEDRAFTVEYRLIRKDGTERVIVERGRPTRGADGLPSHIDGVIFDITEYRRAWAG